MVQGSLKATKKLVPPMKKRSKYSDKKREELKGKVDRATKGSKVTRNGVSADQKRSKTINAKNEVSAAAGAIMGGSKFFLTDITTKGVEEMDKLKTGKVKKESGHKRMENRLAKKLESMGKSM
jgi:hypothetical protein